MDLSDEAREERVTAFREVAGEDLDRETCEALLASNDWNVESTIRNLYTGPSSPRRETATETKNGHFPSFVEQGLNQGSSHILNFTDDDEDEAMPFIGDEGVRARRRGVSPEREVVNTYGYRSRNVNFAVPPAAPRTITSILKELVMGQPVSESAASAARKFALEFDRLVGPESSVPEFFESSFDDALLSASTERRMLAVYLHSSLHPFTESFCKDILCSRVVLNALSGVRIWGGSVEQAEGYLASSKVQAAGYPCIVLIATDRGRDAKIVDRLYVDDIAETNLNDRIAARVIQARNARQPAQQPTVNSRAVDERRRVVEEQDAALQSAIEEDRKRLEEKRAKELREEEERQRKEREETEKLEVFSKKRARVRDEPNAGEIAALRFQFPNGVKYSRRFASSDTIGYVRDVLDVYLVDQLKIPTLRYAIMMNYPKKTLEDDDATLKDAGLVPQAVLFLQDLDA